VATCTCRSSQILFLFDMAKRDQCQTFLAVSRYARRSVNCTRELNLATCPTATSRNHIVPVREHPKGCSRSTHPYAVTACKLIHPYSSPCLHAYHVSTNTGIKTVTATICPNVQSLSRSSLPAVFAISLCSPLNLKMVQNCDIAIIGITIRNRMFRALFLAGVSLKEQKGGSFSVRRIIIFLTKSSRTRMRMNREPMIPKASTAWPSLTVSLLTPTKHISGRASQSGAEITAFEPLPTWLGVK
jgi:hypothetical protein